MKAEDIDLLLDGCGFLGTQSGNLYEYCGMVNGKYYFQDINDQSEGSWLFLTYLQLLSDSTFTVQI